MFAPAFMNSGAGRGWRVQDSEELRRIEALPRRDWRERATGDAAALTQLLRAPGGTQALRPIQAAVLRDLYECKGAVAPIRVGGGKTLISLLAPALLGCQRPLLLVPAKLKHKTEVECEALRKHWQIPEFVRVVSYEFLGRTQAASLLENYRPDIIIADEAHRLKNLKAAVTKRVKRHLSTYRDVRFVALSGTVTKRSIRDYAHILEWALRNGSPAPRNFNDLSEWSLAIDPRKAGEPGIEPGALIRLLTSPEQADHYSRDPQAAIRLAYRDRLISTPGVISSYEDVIGTSLLIRGLDVQLPPEVETYFDIMRSSWRTPDEHPIPDAIALWRHSRELACGFYYRWVPRPPDWWLDPRKRWCKFVRHTLEHNRRGLDSEYMVALACARGDLDDEHYRAWRAVKKQFTPNVEAVWVHDVALGAVREWAKRGPGIIWTDHSAFGRRASTELGIPYFGANGVDANGRPIEQASGDGCVLASVHSNAEGRNLQAWSRNLVVSAPPTGALWEQLLGRTHRDGQQADEVEVDVYLACEEQVRGFWRAVSDASFIEQTTGQPNKLCYADRDVPTLEDFMARR